MANKVRLMRYVGAMILRLLAVVIVLVRIVVGKWFV